ncbi:uncharacterized protein L3040_008134 [Drepanopeziza brunnea f. sp. 'multigermtubi']|uniref:2EXR domain-containing protein n=1 Tax=Marssonina brunnea f. sp. multigermtubi (strain MB_m1) TaxID=1072389 RepID=K1Y181_MARBU|nr:uncharacterized protein MBM_03156 [Drepanopeziza brunnea f. sp. 'multigermtubi' MB_m1]EKD18914.1 hypothetical protein MBM_03156 [Drepanopeziza brunnea f. sp. 'multigermtubi' MB_m1]KAJ5034866.1 hypothetical protein L3040_008134 [Drepanopeziza brunnea f. sp. 'multigermtubi']
MASHSDSDHEAQAEAADSRGPQPDNPVPTSNNPSSSRVRDLCLSLPKLNVNSDAAVEPLPIVSFPQFGRLVIELRRKIWMHASFHPRIVPVRTRMDDPAPAFGGAEQLQAQSRVPAVLHTCAESRIEAQRFYTICIATSTRRPTVTRNLRAATAGGEGGADHAAAAGAGAAAAGEKEEPHGWNFVIHPGHTLPEAEARFPQLLGHDNNNNNLNHRTRYERIPNRIYFVNFAADLFWHPRLHATTRNPFRLFLFRGPPPPPPPPTVSLSLALAPAVTPAGAGATATATAAAGTHPLISQPIHGVLFIRDFNFAADVLARIERLVLPFAYSADILPVLARVPLLRSCAALREVACEVAAVEGDAVEEERGVEEFLEMVEWEGKVVEVLRRDGGDVVKPFERVGVRITWTQDRDHGADDDLAPASAGGSAVGAVPLMENDGLDCAESEESGGSLN